MADEGSSSARKAIHICENFDKALTAILIGNNVVNILSSAMMTVLFTEKFGSGSVGYATAVMTVLVLIFGEILPKSLAKENAESFSVLMAAPLSAFMFLITPLILIFTGIRRGVTALIGSKKSSPSVTEEELKYIIEEIEDEGVLEEQESDLVRSALDFDEKTIREILVPRVSVAALDIGSSPEEIKELFLESRYSRLPVYEKDIDHIVGIIRQADLFSAIVSGERVDIRSLITEPIYITETKKISETLRLMQRKKVHMAVILDQYGGTAGICTLEDIIEELVGEIYDESDEEDTSFIRLSELSCDVSAELSVSDFLDRFGLPEGMIKTERHSMGGWVMELLERIPEQGEHFTAENFEFTVSMQDEQKIDRIRLTLKKPGDDGDNEKNKDTEEK